MISPKEEEEETIDRGNNAKAWSCEKGKFSMAGTVAGDKEE